MRLKNKSEYDAWQNMKKRCSNTGHPQYKHYGGRGITVCSRWQNSFKNFLSDVGSKPSKDHTLDRIDNNGNYEPNNVRWTTWKVQNNNKRLQSGGIEINGVKKSKKDWYKHYRISARQVQRRMKKGMSFEQAVIIPPSTNADKRPVMIENTTYESLKEAARVTGLATSTLRDRLKSKTKKFRSYYYID